MMLLLVNLKQLALKLNDLKQQLVGTEGSYPEINHVEIAVYITFRWSFISPGTIEVKIP